MFLSAMTYWYTEIFIFIILNCRIELSEATTTTTAPTSPVLISVEASCVAFRYVRLEVEDTLSCVVKMSLGEFMLFNSEDTQLTLSGTQSCSNQATSSNRYAHFAVDGLVNTEYWRTNNRFEDLDDGPLGSRSRHWLQVDLGAPTMVRYFAMFFLTPS